jgi:hypothetical protein
MRGCDQTGSWGDWLGGGVDWIRLTHDRDQWQVMINFRLRTINMINFLTSSATISL